ncbi:UNVERIFIED_CONTAM: hypothetical protein Sangu_2747300 [Sesamum angustifolium]|uniref:Uncharacterized protein n=1 Tax=Sesamum angustifolium TaxID=2727405 RepID=A0AAW2IW80_9LAMI
MRLRKDPSALDYNKQQKIYEILQRRIRSGDGVEEGFLCKGKHCSGRIRKLIMASISTTPTTAKNDKNNNNKTHTKIEDSSPIEKIAKKDKNLSINLSAVTEQRQPDPETYPDTLDIAGMDYSQARRKPPIHN